MPTARQLLTRATQPPYAGDMQPMHPRALPDGERFVAFAFAAADMLVELDEQGRIAFAAGAFRARLGCIPESLVGVAPTELIAFEDRHAFAAALALMPVRGRLAHTSFRLADAARTPTSVSGLVLGGPHGPPSTYLAFAPLPGPPEPRLADPLTFLREGEKRLTAGLTTLLGVIELPQKTPADLTERLAAAIAEGSVEGAVATEIAPGRYGLLPTAGEGRPPNLAGLVRRIEAILADGSAPGAVVSATLALERGGLNTAETARALRHALSFVARAGVNGLQEAGIGGDLAGLMARISRRAAGLRRAIAGRRFRLDFQPIVDLASRQVHHHEALLRPEPGVLDHGETPQDLVMLAETIGATEELDIAVARLAFAATPALPSGQRIAFNISGLSAQSRAFRDRLFDLLRCDERAAARVMVELTESAEVEDEETAASTFRLLRDRGVPVCIDDFGAGAAAFRYLKVFPADYVKVDGAFVTAALTAERDRSFVAAMVDLSLAVGARVIAERIETEDAARMMHSLGVHLGQGWHFGKPGPL